MQLNTVIIDSNAKIIDHNSELKLMTADISDLGLKSFDQLYDDACDVGFSMRNPKTGNVTRWALATEIRSNCADNELLGWMFVPCSESIRNNPVLEGYSFNIVND
jgi:hypothetical protein